MGLTRVRAYQVSDSDYKQAVRVISRSNVTLAGGAPSQVDGVNLAQNDRVLVAGQSTGSQNGIYIVTVVGTGSNGTWVRAIDSNQTGEIQAGMIVMVTEGNLYDDTQWKLITDDPIVVGTTALNFELNSAYAFSTIAVAGQSNISADTVGDTFNVAAGNNITITTDASTSTLTIASSLSLPSKISNGVSNVDVSSANSNVTIGVNGTSNVAVFGSTDISFSGNLLPTANITYSLGSSTNRWKDLWLSNATLYLGNVALSGNATSLTYGSNVVLTSIDSTTLSLSGNITSGNILTDGTVSATGNIACGNLATAGTISSSGNITGANLIAVTHFGNLSGSVVSVSGNITGGNVFTGGEISASGRIQGANIIGANLLTSGLISATGNITGNYILGNGSQLTGIDATSIQNGTSNVRVVSSGGNVAIGIDNTSNVAVFANTGAYVAGLISATGNIIGSNLSGTNVTGTLTTAGQPNITSVGTLTSLNSGVISSSGNVTAANLLTSGVISATGNITGGNVSGATLSGNLVGTTASLSGNVTGGNLSGTNVTGTLTTAEQPNITSVGTLSSLSVSGNVQGGNLNISGLISASGNVTAASFYGSGDGLTSIPGANVTGTVANATYATTAGSATSATTANTVTEAAQANITSVGILTSLSVSGTVTGGNLATGGTVSATGNITGGNVSGATLSGNLVGTTASLSGNITGSNILTAGVVSATGNISGNYFVGNGSQLTGISAGGIKFTSVANTAPTTPSNGDFWFDTYTSTKYQYINDGTSSQWVDQSFPTSFSSISVGGITNSNANGVGNIGSSGGYFNTIFAKATSAQYADLAENYESDANYAPGTVVVFGGEKEITTSTVSLDSAVAGIVSTNPSYLMNSGQTGKYILPVALTGRVPCLVQGPVKKGDILVTSNLPGTAQKLTSSWVPGCVIGKSLENIDDNVVKLIEVAVGRF